jgi:hypothetical protein
MSTNLSNPIPQFGTAEFQGGPDRCKSCGQLLGARYYRIGQAQACEICAEKAKIEGPKDTHAAFVRALIFASGGALLGLIAYSTFGIVTGIVLGYLSLLVGYLVGKAMMMGSGGVGGRRYQIAAVLLTYAAVSLSAVPIGIAEYAKERATPKASAAKAAPGAQSGSASQAEGADSESVEEGAAPKPKMSFGAAIGALLLAGLASPFLALQDPFHGVIGLVILSVGIRIAWQMTAGKAVEILGPFNRPASPPPTAG